MYIIQVNEESSEQHERNNEHGHQSHCGLQFRNYCGVKEAITG